MARNPALAGAIHDLQARLGSIRIAVTAVVGLDLDEDTRRDMLTSASDESVRAGAELAAIGALASCLLDDAPDEDCDLRAAVETAAEMARLAGLDVDVRATNDAHVRANPERLAAALPCLIRLAAGAGKTVRVSLSDAGLALAGTDPEPIAPIGNYLVDQLGSAAITFGKIA